MPGWRVRLTIGIDGDGPVLGRSLSSVVRREGTLTIRTIAQYFPGRRGLPLRVVKARILCSGSRERADVVRWSRCQSALMLFTLIPAQFDALTAWAEITRRMCTRVGGGGDRNSVCWMGPWSIDDCLNPLALVEAVVECVVHAGSQ